MNFKLQISKLKSTSSAKKNWLLQKSKYFQLKHLNFKHNHLLHIKKILNIFGPGSICFQIVSFCRTGINGCWTFKKILLKKKNNLPSALLVTFFLYIHVHLFFLSIFDWYFLVPFKELRHFPYHAPDIMKEYRDW